MEITPKTALPQILVAIYKELRALVAGSGGSSSGLTDAQLRATPVAASVAGVATEATSAAINATTGTVSDGPWGGGDGTIVAILKAIRNVVLTDGQLRASPISTTDTNLGSAEDSPATTDTGTFSLIALFKRLLQKTTSGIAVTVPRTTTATIVTVTTSTTGTDWVTFSSQACSALDIVNATGTALRYRRGGTGSFLVIPDNSSRLVIGITNANQIDVQRNDTSNTPVDVRAEAIA